VKRRELIRQLLHAGCILRRSGGDHDIYSNPITGRKALVPRHTEIPESLCKLIKKQLGID
jgi:mRNA interferase HicA